MSMETKNDLLDKLKHSARVLKAESYALYLAYKHPGTPWYARLFTGLVAAYAFSPIDLIPDFIPVLGYIDDLILIPLGVALALKMIPTEVMEECQSEAKVLIAEGEPVSRAAAVVIVTLWLGIIVWGIILILEK